MKPVIHWFRRDLRLSDNLALNAALASQSPVIPLFIFDPAILSSPHFGLPRMKFMLGALKALDETLQARGSQLIIRHGKPAEILPQFAAEVEATAVYLNSDITPYARRRDAAVSAALDVDVHRYDDALILPPGTVMKQNGDPYTVYTPFMKQWKTLPKPDSVEQADGLFVEFSDELGSEPYPEFDCEMDVPVASQTETLRRLEQFMNGPIFNYDETRNRLTADPFQDDDTSCLSPYLRFGLLSPRQTYWAARAAYGNATENTTRQSVETWVNELIWREFYMHIMFHFPHVAKGNFRAAYDDLEWRDDPEGLQAWRDGQTGYPVIDAAMRQLKAMGWMPNRARMIVASFLTKDLLIDWREGERHFMQWLIDGDPAANNGGWQWSAGTGTDAQPYFRIFNPVSQSQKFDPDGAYIRRWVSELNDVSDRFIHAPWEMDMPPVNYPPPIVDHGEARERALAAYKSARSEKEN